MAKLTQQAAGPGTGSLNDLTVVAGYEDLLRANGLGSLEALFAASHGESLQKPGLDAWRERIRLTVKDDGRQRLLYLKRFRDPPPRARREVRRSGSGASSVAGMEWTWMHRLAGDGIPCVKPVAFGEELDRQRERRSAILAEAVPGQALESWVARWGEEDRRVVRSLIGPTAKLVARFHACGYVHRDLYLSHVFLDPGARIDHALHLIDLQRVVRPPWRRRRWVVKDLAALDFSAPAILISRTDRVRWLKQYLGVSKLDGPAKCLAYRIIGKTLSIGRHDCRRTARIRRAGGWPE